MKCSTEVKSTREMMKRIFLTLIITNAYCGMWMGLEHFFFGGVVNRDVDNVMMILFIPVIFLATEPVVRRLDKFVIARKNKGVNPLCFDCLHFKSNCDGFQDLEKTSCSLKK